MKPQADNWVIGLQRSLARWDVTLAPEYVENFSVYLDELSKWNEKMSLTALKEPDHVSLGHFADSLAPLSLDQVFKAKGVHAIDIGSGAGFPGLPLKVVNPTWHMALVESVGKKCDFLRAAISAMELSKVSILQERCELLAHDKEHRERYDLAFARALSNLSTLIEYGLPFLKVGGFLVAHRGRTAADEVTRINVALEELGGQVIGVHHYEIAGMAGARALVLIEKIKPVSKHYPRRIGVPAKRPL